MNNQHQERNIANHESFFKPCDFHLSLFVSQLSSLFAPVLQMGNQSWPIKLDLFSSDWAVQIQYLSVLINCLVVHFTHLFCVIQHIGATLVFYTACTKIHHITKECFLWTEPMLQCLVYQSKSIRAVFDLLKYILLMCITEFWIPSRVLLLFLSIQNVK